MAGKTECAACGTEIVGEVKYTIHRDDFSEGPQVPLCEPCGADDRPTCEELWEAIRVRMNASYGKGTVSVS